MADANALPFGSQRAAFLLAPGQIEVREIAIPRPEAGQVLLRIEPLACVVHGLELLDWRGVDRVLFLGLGVMGLLFAQLLPRYTQAARAGAGRRASRLQLARRFGLTPVWDAGERSLAEQFDCVI